MLVFLFLSIVHRESKVCAFVLFLLQWQIDERFWTRVYELAAISSAVLDLRFLGNGVFLSLYVVSHAVP